jgi:hypothetical protein
MKLEKFADIIGVDLKITYYANQQGRFCVQFYNGELMHNGMLRSAHGNGKTYEEAARDYAKEIRGGKLAIDAFTNLRKEFNVPEDLE